jgi:hypothetical protein
MISNELARDLASRRSKELTPHASAPKSIYRMTVIFQRLTFGPPHISTDIAGELRLFLGRWISLAFSSF